MNQMRLGMHTCHKLCTGGSINKKDFPFNSSLTEIDQKRRFELVIHGRIDDLSSDKTEFDSITWMDYT